jgi:U5 small nuclear ribonucleoprotein component
MQSTHIGSLSFLSSFYSPSPAAAAMGKVARCYSGSMESKPALAMKRCDPNGPLMIHCVKLYSANDGQSFETFGRIYSGTKKTWLSQL